MAFEYLVVLFPRRRRVKMNDMFLGHTNKLLEVEGGEYTVTLGPPKNFTPDEHQVDLHNTAPSSPKFVEFEEAESP